MCRNRTDSKQFCGGISAMSGARGNDYQLYDYR